MKQTFTLWILLFALVAVAGCAGVHNSMRPSEKSSQWNVFKRQAQEKNKPSKFAKKKKEAPPVSMQVIWTDDVLEKPGTASVRGFGGRIYFHDGANEPVRAEGELVIYGFDDSQAASESGSKRPTKKFVFTQEQLQSYYSETDLGPSYSVWIPWETVGGYRKTIALVPVFKTAEGKILNGGATNNVLRGKPLEGDEQLLAFKKSAPNKTSHTVTQAGYTSNRGESKQVTQAVMNQEEAEVPKIRSTTINLPPSLATHFTQPGNSGSGLAGQSPTQTVKPVAPNKEASLTNGIKPQATPATNAKMNATSGEISAEPAKDSVPAATSTRKTPSVFGAPGAFR
jgi:hypothetical protein